MVIQNTVKSSFVTVSRTCHVFAISVLALRFHSSNSCMDQFVTAGRKSPLTPSLEEKLILELRHNIHMYPYFLFAAIHHLNRPCLSVRPRSSVGRVTVDLIRRSWVRFPPRSKDFFFTSCGSLIPFTRANAQWVIHGFN